MRKSWGTLNSLSFLLLIRIKNTGIDESITFLENQIYNDCHFIHRFCSNIMLTFL